MCTGGLLVLLLNRSRENFVILSQTQCAARGSAPCRGKPGAWKAARLVTRPDQLVRVGKSAQEQFLEYAHYLPERSVQAAVDRQRVAGFAVLESTELAQDMDASQVQASCAPELHIVPCCLQSPRGSPSALVASSAACNDYIR